MVPKRPETSSGCYKSQSFFFPKTSRNPTRPGNPNLNDTSSTPENRVQLFSTKISKDPIRLASKIRLDGHRQSSSVFNQTKGQLTVPRPVRAERSGWADGLQIWASVWLGFVNSKQLSVGKWWQRKVAFLRPNLKSHPSEVGQNALGQHVPSLKKRSKFWKMNKPSPGRSSRRIKSAFSTKKVYSTVTKHMFELKWDLNRNIKWATQMHWEEFWPK